MRGVIMAVENGRAVLLTDKGNFINIPDRGYSVGSRASFTQNTGRLCAVAASFLAVCVGVGSYFTPAGYVSVDINPSLIMTVNIYDRVINARPLNSDAELLLENADIMGKSANETVGILIRESERIGYLNESNDEVILEVVSGAREIKIESAGYKNAEVIVERAEKADLRAANEMCVSIARAKAISEYTDINGGTVSENAEKLVDKSVKEIRKNLSSAPAASTPQPTLRENIAAVVSPRPDTKPARGISPAANANQPTITQAEQQAALPTATVNDSVYAAPPPSKAPEKEPETPSPLYEIIKSPAEIFAPPAPEDKKTDAVIENGEPPSEAKPDSSTEAQKPVSAGGSSKNQPTADNHESDDKPQRTEEREPIKNENPDEASPEQANESQSQEAPPPEQNNDARTEEAVPPNQKDDAPTKEDPIQNGGNRVEEAAPPEQSNAKPDNPGVQSGIGGSEPKSDSHENNFDHKEIPPSDRGANGGPSDAVSIEKN